jgi:hypothetical protein
MVDSLAVYSVSNPADVKKSRKSKPTIKRGDAKNAPAFSQEEVPF